MKKLYFLIVLFSLSLVGFAQTTVFINEIHYDNSGADVNEGFEVAGPAGTDLTNWSIVLYNGSTSSTGDDTYDTVTLSGTIPDQDNGYGTLWFTPTSSIQNGAPDGIALVDDTSTVIQFLSYEGSFTAEGGPADTMASTDIGVAETSSTLSTESLQLIGTGTTYEDFTWSGPAASSNGAVNSAQSFSTASNPSLLITAPTDNAEFPSGTTNVDISILVQNFNVANGTGDGHIHWTINGGGTMMKYDTLDEGVAVTDGQSYTVYMELVDNSHVPIAPAVNATVNFSVLYPCDLNIGTITTTCDAVTAGVDTYTTTLAFTGGGTSQYTIDTGGVGSVGGDNPSNVASGTITITGVNEGTDFVVTFTGDPSDSSCDFTRNITAPGCIPVVCANPGDIIITEIMQNPSAVSDSAGEWFEIYNTTGAPIDIAGWDFKDSSNSAEDFTINSSLVVPAGGYIVLGNNANSGTNGGVSVDYEYSGMFLGNGADELAIECSSTLIDEVNWDGGTTFPDPNGASMELAISAYNSTDNDVGANWGEGTSAYGDGDLGTPGAMNDFTLSVNSFSNTAFSMYPNPNTTGLLYITATGSDIVKADVYDILGKRVLSEVVNNGTLNVTNLNAGLYIVKLTQGSASVTQKLVIK